MARMTLAWLRRRINDVRQFMVGPGTPELVDWRHEIHLTATEWAELRADQEFFDALHRVGLARNLSAITTFDYQGVKIFVPH